MEVYKTIKVKKYNLRRISDAIGAIRTAAEGIDIPGLCADARLMTLSCTLYEAAEDLNKFRKEIIKGKGEIGVILQ